MGPGIGNPHKVPHAREEGGGPGLPPAAGNDMEADGGGKLRPLGTQKH